MVVYGLRWTDVSQQLAAVHFWGNWPFSFGFHSFYPSFLYPLTGVIAVVIFIIFCIIAIMSRFLYQHKQAHRNSQKKEKEYPENLESSFKADIDLQNTVSECKREYFIWWTVQFPLLTLPPLTSFSLALSPSLFSFWFFFFYTHFLLASFLFGKDRPAQETLRTITVPHSLHKNLAITFTSAAQETCYPILH